MHFIFSCSHSLSWPLGTVYTSELGWLKHIPIQFAAAQLDPSAPTLEDARTECHKEGTQSAEDGDEERLRRFPRHPFTL